MSRPATTDDVPAVADVQVSSWRGVYRGLIPQELIDRLTVERRIAQWNAFLARGSADETLMVAEHDGDVVGMASLGPCRDDDATDGLGEVRAIYVTPDHWGHGHGRELMEDAVSWLATAGFTEATLWVLDTNARARRFYEAAGWATDTAERVEEIDGTPLAEVRYRVDLARV
jgi:GNAT superfamily N-acetyltransferase